MWLATLQLPTLSNRKNDVPLRPVLVAVAGSAFWLQVSITQWRLTGASHCCYLLHWKFTGLLLTKCASKQIPWRSCRDSVGVAARPPAELLQA